MNRQTLYVAGNACFFLLVLGGLALSGASTAVHPLYLILLFALCSSPILQLRTYNDRYGLLVVFSCCYFMFYGLLDLVTLLTGQEQPGESGILSEAELVILAGGAAAQIAYRIACHSPRAVTARPDYDWSERTLVFGGAALWTVCTWITWQFKVHVLVDNTLETEARGLGSLSGLHLIAIMLAAYLQPLGIVILAYAQCRYRRPYVLLLLIGALVIEMIFGLVSDSKGQVLIGVVLLAVTKLLVDGTIPRTRLVIAAAVVVLVFPILQANRVALGERGSTHEQAAQNFTETLTRAFAAKDRVQSGRDRAETIFERSSLKHSVAMIVAGSGRTVPYQHGYTLSPLLTVFIPRLIWPTKPDVVTGRLVNKEFKLYWNFGWPGVLGGMTLIGGLLGFVGRRYDLSESITLTRILILIATIKFIVLGFEGAIAVQYSVWVRVLLAIGVLHLLFARLPISSQKTAGPPHMSDAVTTTTPGERFPNLLR
jgi:hypothetical protein